MLTTIPLALTATGHPCSSNMLFTGVKYVVSSSYPEYRQLELEKLLDANDATKVDLRQATHIITRSPQFEGSEKVSPDAAVVSVRQAQRRSWM